MFTWCVVAAAVAASPVPAEPRAAAVPAGRYVLAGGPEAAAGDDVWEMTKAFKLRPGQYVLSGGPSPADPVTVADDLELRQGDAVLFADADRTASTVKRGKQTASYQGWPVVLALDSSKKLRVRATDHGGGPALGELWLHRADGGRVRLTPGAAGAAEAARPHLFFDESFAVGGFEAAPGLKFDAEVEMPARPAMLLARFARRAVDPGQFLASAITDGLAEDGVPRELVKQLCVMPDFLKQCKLCNLTHSALATYANRPDQPKAQPGKGLKAELVKDLKSADAAVRQPALKKLVDGYVERGFERQNLTKEVRKRIADDFADMRKAAMDGLPKGQKFCPSCDGACQLRPPF